MHSDRPWRAAESRMTRPRARFNHGRVYELSGARSARAGAALRVVRRVFDAQRQYEGLRTGCDLRPGKTNVISSEVVEYECSAPLGRVLGTAFKASTGLLLAVSPPGCRSRLHGVLS